MRAGRNMARGRRRSITSAEKWIALVAKTPRRRALAGAIVHLVNTWCVCKWNSGATLAARPVASSSACSTMSRACRWH